MKLPIILLILSAFTHSLFFGHPREVVFDEVYMGSFVSAYETGEYYFDIHPPLAKLMAKVVGDIIGSPYNVDFGLIGNDLPWEMVLLRILPLIGGILLPVVIYLICRNLNLSYLSSFLAGLLIILENSLLTQSRFILFDSLLLLFGFSSLLFYLMYLRKTDSMRLLALSALFSSFAFSIKWTGLAFPLLICIMEITRIKDIKKSLKFFGVFAVIGIAIYFTSFAIHFSLLKNTGAGDAFMSADFQSTLNGSPMSYDSFIKPKGLVGKFIELNTVMYFSNKNLTATHAYSSEWYTWPIMKRSVFYWQNEGGGAYVYFLGNPLIYWLGTLSIICLLIYLLKKKFKDRVALLILLGFIVNFLPFMFIGRVMFLYHYEAALVFSILAIVFFLDMSEKQKILMASMLVLVSTILFIYFSPLSYGLKLNQEQLDSRMWLSTWR